MHSVLVEAPGVKPAKFKLAEKAADSFDLYRSTRKLGTARVEGREWTARFRFGGKEWNARANSAEALLRLIGAFILAHEARDKAARPLEEAKPELSVKGRKTAEERISIEFERRAQKNQVAKLEEIIAKCRERIWPEERGEC